MHHRNELADVEKTQTISPEHARELEEKRRAFLREPQAYAVGGCNARPMDEAEIVAEFFKYHPPNELSIPKYAAINQAAKNFAEVLLANCPRGADRSAAIRLIREARMTANAAIALDGLSL